MRKNEKKQEKIKITQTFLKWAGNKRKIIHEIIPLLPKGKRLIEPFCGSAAVFLNTNYKKTLHFKQNMTGTADIITEELPLAARIINPIKSLFYERF